MSTYSMYPKLPLFLLCLFLNGSVVLAQLPTAPTPQFEGPNGQPLQPTRPAVPVYPYPPVKMGLNADDVKEMAQRTVQRILFKQLAEEDDLEDDFRPDPGKLHPLDEEILDLFREFEQQRQTMIQTEHYRSEKFRTDFSNYYTARNELVGMLKGHRALSIKDAFYAAEQAFGNLHLSYDEYNELIDQNADFIRQWLTERDIDLNDPEALHFGIQQFMTDTLTVTITDPETGMRKTMTHFPYFYDYIDYEGTEDRRNYFVTKTLATGTGQCHTLPVTYLVLAEALGVDVYLSYNPQHSFVRFQNNSGAWINYETTIGQFIPDQFYLDEMPAMQQAFQNGLYVQELNKRQVVATVLIDLAVSFIEEHWLADGGFVISCMEQAREEFPGHLFINASSHYVNRKLLSAQFNSVAMRYQVTRLRDVEQYPEVQQAYEQLKEYLALVQESGIDAYPEAEYLEMIRYHDEKGRLQRSKQIDTKTKKSLFSTY